MLLTVYKRKERIIKKQDVKIGGVYVAKISSKLSPVRILSVSQYCDQHWIAENLCTRRQVVIRSAQKLRGELEPVFTRGIRRWKRKEAI